MLWEIGGLFITKSIILSSGMTYAFDFIFIFLGEKGTGEDLISLSDYEGLTKVDC